MSAAPCPRPTRASAGLPACCRRTGPATSRTGREPWCRCKKTPGPYVAPAGHVTMYVFEGADAATFREQCRLAGNAERGARDALSARFVRCGSGWRELPKTSPKRAALEAAYAKALRTLRALQRKCSHPHRSIFNGEACGVCYATLGGAP